MTKKETYYKQALALYTELYLTFDDIAEQIPVTSRTLRSWSKKNNWQQIKVKNQNHLHIISKDTKEIALNLAQIIKQKLRDGKEPSATSLNAFSKLASLTLNVQKFNTENKKEDTTNDDILAEKTFLETFGKKPK